MALVKCPDCGHDVSDQAVSCIGCGRPTAAPGTAATAASQASPKKARDEEMDKVIGLASTTAVQASSNKDHGSAVWIAIIAIIILVAGAGAVVASGALSAKHTLTGTISVSAADNSQTLDWLTRMTTSTGEAQLGGPCSTAGAYSDITAGTDVTVRDDTDKVVGSAFLAAGTLDITATSPVCVFEFTVAGIPDAKSYAIEIGQRRGVTYSVADLNADKWSVALTAH